MGVLKPLSLSAALWAASLILPSVLLAQAEVLVIYEPSIDSQLRVDISGVIGEHYRLVAVDDYVAAASAQNLYPLSEQAFRRILPNGGVALAVVIVPRGNGLMMVLRSGQDGSVVGQQPIPRSGGGLAPVARQGIPRAIAAALGQGPPGQAPTAGVTAPSAPQQPDSAYGDDTDDTGETDDEDADTSDERLIRLQVDAGFGLASRDVEFPYEEGLGTLAVGPSAAMDLGLRMLLYPENRFSLAFQMRYQSTIGASIDEQHVAGPSRTTGIRSSRYEVMIAPYVNIGDVAQLYLAAGYGLRGLRPDVHHLKTPSYTLGGPVARAVISFTIGAVTVSLAPEAQLLIAIGDALQERGVDGSGLSLGGEASVAVHVDGPFSLTLNYREAHASMPGQAGKPEASDVERYVTFGARGSL